MVVVQCKAGQGSRGGAVSFGAVVFTTVAHMHVHCCVSRFTYIISTCTREAHALLFFLRERERERDPVLVSCGDFLWTFMKVYIFLTHFYSKDQSCVSYLV